MAYGISEVLFHLPPRDGIAIAIRKWTGVAAPKAVLLVAHGMGEHSGRYLAPLSPIIADGFVTYAPDHRGHGMSVVGDAYGDYGPGGYQGLVDDLATLAALARAENPGLPVVLLGHSMGSFLAQGFVLDHMDAIDALALSGSAAVDIIAAAAMTNPEMVGNLNAPFEPARTAFDWLSRDDAQVDAYIADPLCGFSLVPESFLSLLSQGARLADADELTRIDRSLPIYIFSGDKDPLFAPLGAVVPLIHRYLAAGLSVQSRIYPDARHEVLNETNRDDVVGHLHDWLGGVIARRRVRQL